MRPEYGRALGGLSEAGIVTACYGVYLGEVLLQDGPARVLPLLAFPRLLFSGRVLSPRKV